MPEASFRVWCYLVLNSGKASPARQKGMMVIVLRLAGSGVQAGAKTMLRHHIVSPHKEKKGTAAP